MHSEEINFPFGRKRNGFWMETGKDIERKMENWNRWITVLITIFVNLFAFDVEASVDGAGGTVSSIAGFSSALGNAVSINGNVVKLTDDVSLKNTLVINTDVVLDLGGKKISFVRAENKDLIAVQCKSGTIILKNGRIEGKQTSSKWSTSAYGTAIDIQANTNVTIINCDVFGESQGGWSTAGLRPDGTAIQYYSGTLNLISGTFNASSEKGSAYALWTKNGNVANFRYGSVIRRNGSIISSGETVAPVVIISPINYSINYDSQNGTITSVDHLKSYTTLDIINDNVIDLASVSRGGYFFEGWEYENKVIDKLTLPFPNVDKDTHTITLTANWSPIPYIIKYDMAGGTNSSSNITSYDITKGTFNLVNPQSRVGYEFIGWYDSENNKITSITYNQVKNAVNQTYTITARWKPIDYTVNFTVETTAGKSLIYTVETTDTSLPFPVYSVVPIGREFDGWQNEQREKITSLPISNPIPLTLSPIWKDIIYYAYFYDENSSLLSDLTKSYITQEGLSSTLFPSYSKVGYIFEGWFKEYDENHSASITSIPTGTAEDTKLYAYITPILYSLTYDLKGGTYSGNKQITYTFSEKTKLLTDKDVSYVGHAFKGWYLQENFSGSALTEAPVTDGIVSNGGRNVAFTAYAKWEKIDYTIVFKTDGGTPVDNASYNVTDGIPADKMPKTSKVGYKFLGWYKGDTKIDKINPGHEELELIAKWELIPYSIIYNLNGGTNPTDAVFSYTYEETVLLPRPTRDNYKFSNWYENSDFTGNPVTEIPNHTTGDKVFYARWEPKKYTISFNTNGGSEIADQTYTYGEETAFALKTRKTNYTFDGWYKDAALTDFFGDKISATSSGSFTLYAKWVPVVYAIEYDCYYGTNPSNAATSYTINDEVVLPTPTRENFTFAGWYDNDYLTGEKQTKIAKGSSGNVKFYATWARANTVLFTQPQNGKITIIQGGKELKSGDRVAAEMPLTITASTTKDYVLQNMVVNGTSYTSSPQIVPMPAKDGLVVSATFVENPVIPSAPAPELIITPSGVDKFPKGEDVKVQLKKTDESTTLYYSLDGSAEKKYEREFAIGSAQDTVLLKAIARKTGFRDGVTSRYIIFDNGKITLTFDLPLGVKAVNPSGGEVVTATTTGGSFEFELKVDKEYYTNLDSMVVSANDSIIKPGSAGLYTLSNCSSDVTITVAGLKAKVCTVTLQQTENGNISFTDGAEETTTEVEYGASVSITAKADEDFKFLQWSTGSQSNPLKLTVDKDTTISARFISDYKAYAVTLPQLEGVTVKPFSGYSTEVKKDGTFKFYLKLADGYREENLVVRANGEELEKNKGGYAIYYINKNISISVEGIVREPISLKVPENVQAKVVETMTDPSGERVYGETMILLYAEAPAGKTLSKWTDGKTDNPRLATAQDAAQLHPLFVDKDDENYAKVTLHQSPGAAITTVNANIDAVKKDEMVQLKVVLLPAYSQSDVILTVDDEVIKPEISLRAASETKTYVFFVPVKKNDMAVKVSGMKRNSYHVSITQTNGGTVSATSGGEITHGETVRLKAQPEPGMLFIKWWDGNTLNPYPYVVTSDTEVKAYFVGIESTVDNETIRKEENVRITVGGGTLSILTAEASMVYIWDHKGALFHAQKVSAGRYTFDLPAGIYLIKVGDLGVKKVMVGGTSA